MNATRILKYAAPYIAVAICWFWLSNAWLAIIAYHGQILLWARLRLPMPDLPPRTPWLLAILPALLVGPLLYLLLPHLSGGHLAPWLAQHHITRTSLLIMLPYFGIIHPWIEQTHWNDLRRDGLPAHLLFAAYHVAVLAQMAAWPWLLLVFAVLAAVSWFWALLTRRTGSLTPAYCTHALADLGIVLAAILRL